MPVSRGRKRKQRRTEAQAAPRKASPAPKTKISWSKISEWLGAIAAILAICGAIYDALREPEIRTHSGVILNPFELSVSLRNPSFIFAMKNMQIKCVDKEIVLSGGSRFSNNIFDDGALVTILPGRTAEYKCPFDRFIGHPMQPTILAQIIIAVDFKTLWFTRPAQSEQFTWTAQSQQWIEGDIIN